MFYINPFIQPTFFSSWGYRGPNTTAPYPYTQQSHSANYPTPPHYTHIYNTYTPHPAPKQTTTSAYGASSNPPLHRGPNTTAPRTQPKQGHLQPPNQSQQTKPLTIPRFARDTAQKLATLQVVCSETELRKTLEHTENIELTENVIRHAQYSLLNIDAICARTKLELEEQTARAAITTELTTTQPQSASDARETLELSPQSLESRLGDSCLPKDDILKHPNPFITYNDFIEPNEIFPESVVQSLNQITTPGVIVSVGTHRSLFDLMLCDPEKCTGLVIVDINPRIKAFMDFLILLLKISDSMEEFAELSKPTGKAKLQEKLDIIRQKTVSSPFVTEKLRRYYLQHLDRHGAFYFSQSQYWRTGNSRIECFAAVQYDKNPQQFERLQRKAREGNIVVHEGSINDLTFLGDIPIAAIDTSNVSSYIPLDIKITTHISQPIVITTVGTGQFPTVYRAECLPMPMSDKDKDELKKLLQLLSRFFPSFNNGHYTGSDLQSFIRYWALPNASYPGFTTTYLEALREMLKNPRWVLTSKGALLLGQENDYYRGARLTELSIEEVKRLSQADIETKGNNERFRNQAWLERSHRHAKPLLDLFKIGPYSPLLKEIPPLERYEEGGSKRLALTLDPDT